MNSCFRLISGKSSLIELLRILLYVAGIGTVTSKCTFTTLTGNDTKPCKGLISCSGEITSVADDIARWGCKKKIFSDRGLRLEIKNHHQKIDDGLIYNLNKFSDPIVSLSLKNCTVDRIERFIDSLDWTSEIDLSQNQIKKFNISNFVYTRHMTFLNLSNNAIDTLDMGNDNYIAYSLVVLDLSHNLIKTVPRFYFRWKLNMQHLNLSFNAIEYIDDEAFYYLANLKSLFITNNKLTQIGSFVRRLKELRIDFNKFTTLDDIKINRNSSLKRVTASNNNLKTIGNILQYTPELNELDVSHNHIEIILKSQFYSFANNLTCLDLSYNNIWKTENGTFEGKNITHFKINNNEPASLLQSNDTFQSANSTDSTYVSKESKINTNNTIMFVDETDSIQGQNVSTVVHEPCQQLNDVVLLDKISKLLDAKLEHVTTSITKNITIAIKEEIKNTINNLKDFKENLNNITDEFFDKCNKY